MLYVALGFMGRLLLFGWGIVDPRSVLHEVSAVRPPTLDLAQVGIRA